jgi:hypothetical protein
VVLTITHPLTGVSRTGLAFILYKFEIPPPSGMPCQAIEALIIIFFLDISIASSENHLLFPLALSVFFVVEMFYKLHLTNDETNEYFVS